MWKSLIDTKEVLEQTGSIEKLERLYYLSIFWKFAVYSKDYSADKSWPTLLVLTEEGQLLNKELDECESLIKDENYYLSLFGRFFHHDIIIDHLNTDIDGIEQLLEQEIISGKIFFPHRFGRTLYDNFNDNIKTTRTSHLLHEDTKKLLEGSPKGVYQVGDIVIGPLGVLHALTPRMVQPSLTLPLWHCSDTGCNSPHFVALVPPANGKICIARSQVEQFLTDKVGPASEWNGALRWSHRKGELENWRKYSAILELIADTIIGDERTKLMTLALQGVYKSELRALINREKNSNVQ